MVIQHNLPAINAHRNLGINNSSVAKNLEKLSSGYKINRAGDDAAGLAISEKMRGQISGLGMAEQNASNGISLIQTAEGGLNETHSILQRMRELAVQSSNGTYQDEDRAQIELEYQALKSEIDRIASYTNYNGIKLLDGTVGGVQLKNATPDPAADLTKIANPTWANVGSSVPTTINTTWSDTLDWGINSVTTKVTKGLSITGDPAGLNYSAGTANQDFIDQMAKFGITATGTAINSAAFKFTGSTTTKFTAADIQSKDVKIVYDDGKGAWFAEMDGFERAQLADGATSANLYLKNHSGNDDYKLTIDFGDATTGLLAFSGTDAKAKSLAHGSSITYTTSATLAPASVNSGTGALSTAISTAVGNYNLTTKPEIDPAATVDIKMDYDAATKQWALGSVSSELLDATKWDFAGATYNTVSGVISLKAADFATSKKEITFTMNTPLLAPIGAQELASGSFTMSVSAVTNNPKTSAGLPTTLTNAGVTKFGELKLLSVAPGTDKFVKNADTDRADRMLASMGLSNKSTFDVSTALAGGSATDKILYASLNNKDAYIITRDSTKADERNEFDATSQYETLLQVGDKTYIGRLNGTTMEFMSDETANAKVVATLTNAALASETGSIRFNTGDQNSGYYKAGLIDKEGAIIGSENQASLVFQIGANGAEDQRVGMYVLNMSSNNLGDHEKGMFISESSIITRDDANNAVNTIDKAVNYVSAQRARLGALQNRLEHTLNNLGVTKENLVAAESSIRDVDMAKEMMNFTKNNILIQASQAMLAQANQIPQGVLSLLR